ncbi:hypothetical protein [Exiguobacterium antarcticum]|uniref:hypothetical protein n=1 Tax=Exiguobacterium antarcticum TaxID=132920 RepID=UPI00047A34A6|nr:hypothetical protein [Exiguobacterium antarcticum]
MIFISNKIKKNELPGLYVDIFVSCLMFSTIVLLDNSLSSLKPIGVMLLIGTFYLLYKARKNSQLLIFFGLITYVNVSVAFGDLLQVKDTLGYETLFWQTSLRNSEFNVLAAKSLLLVISVINLFLNSKFIKKIEVERKIEKKDNKYIFFGGLIVLFTFWFFGYGGSMGNTYESNTRTIYEYSILVFIVVWFYSGNSKVHQYLLYFFVALYVIQSLIRGDRSSAFPMLIALILVNNYKINLKYLFLLAFSGITVSNIVSAYRLSFSINDFFNVFMTKYGLSSLLSDTVSQSYYTGISIIFSGNLIENSSKYFPNFLAGIVFGGGFNNADVGAISYNYAINKGGGFFFSWFYFWFGILGVLVAAIFLGYLLRMFFVSNNNYLKLYTICLISMTLRWYLYTPFVLFRTVLFIFTLLLILCFVIEKLTVRKKNKFLSLGEAGIKHEIK